MTRPASQQVSLSFAVLQQLDDKLEAAFNLHQQGQLAQAEVLYRQILQQQPQHFEALRLLAMIIRQSNPEHALELFDQALNINPTHISTWNNRGNALNDLQRFAEAIRSYDQALMLKPDYPDAWYNRGVAYAQLENWQQATNCYQQALKINPLYPDALNQCGLAYSKQHLHEQALACFEQTLRQNPHQLAAWVNCGNSLCKLGRFQQALTCFDKALAINPNLAEVLNNYALCLHSLQRSEQAIAYFSRALALKPDYVEALHNQGATYLAVNQLAAAEQCFCQALALKPDFIEGRYSLTLLENGVDKANLEALLTIKQAVQSQQTILDHEHNALLHFSLGRIYDADAEYAAAFKHFQIGCQLKRACFTYDATAISKFVDTIIAYFNQDLCDRLRGAGNLSALPIFIVGMPRSGTTLVEQIIASHPDVHGGGELFDLMAITQFDAGNRHFFSGGHQLLAEQIPIWGQAYIDRLQTLTKSSRVTDKMMSHFFALGLIHLMLPNAKIIHVKRDAMATCWSCLSTWFNDTNPYSYDMLEMGHYYLDYARLMAHWRNILPTDAFMEISYEELITDPITVSQQLTRYCGLDWHEQCLNFYQQSRQINTASMVQVRQPIYQTSLQRWRNYQPFLAPLADLLNHFNTLGQTKWP